MTRDLVEPLLILAGVAAVLGGWWVLADVIARRVLPPRPRHPRSLVVEPVGTVLPFAPPYDEGARRLLLDRCREMDAGGAR